jgi:hypothetical protein
MKKHVKLSWFLIVTFLVAVISTGSVSAEPNQMVFQVDASLSFGEKVQFTKAPFVLLEGEPSTLAEEGIGGHKVELVVKSNGENVYTLQSRIFNYTKSGFNLLGSRNLKLRYEDLGELEFKVEPVGRVAFQAKIVKRAMMTIDSNEFNRVVR